MLSIASVGLDVHAKETAAVMLDRQTGELQVRQIVGRPERSVLEWLASLERPFRALYEAGPAGYGLARRARVCNLDVVVCSPWAYHEAFGRPGEDRSA